MFYLLTKLQKKMLYYFDTLLLNACFYHYRNQLTNNKNNNNLFDVKVHISTSAKLRQFSWKALLKLLRETINLTENVKIINYVGFQLPFSSGNESCLMTGETYTILSNISPQLWDSGFQILAVHGSLFFGWVKRDANEPSKINHISPKVARYSSKKPQYIIYT